jgi:metal-responsive CopG/Arc/MetJ family transcriptional regulator
MAVRITVDIPEPLHDRLRSRAESSETSIRSLIVRAIDETYNEPTSPFKHKRAAAPSKAAALSG